MKAINFSVVEILPSLLDKSKTQTIRPAWVNKIIVDSSIDTNKKAEKLANLQLGIKPPRFKVKEQVRLFITI